VNSLERWYIYHRSRLCKKRPTARVYSAVALKRLRLKTELAIKADVESLPPKAWSRRDFEKYLAERREAWNAPQSLTSSGLIDFLVDNDIAKERYIQSKEYGRKARYVTGNLSLLPFACSFYKNSYLCHSTALHIHGLASLGSIFVNHEQTPKNTTSRLSQRGIDQAFHNQPRRSAYKFETNETTITFLNGKNTRNAGVINAVAPSGETVPVTSLERTLIDCVVRPQYAGGIHRVIEAFSGARGAVSGAEIVRLLKVANYAYPYHQSLGFLLDRVGTPTDQLAPLKSVPVRFKFYLDYGMETPAFNPTWKIFHPPDLPGI
jgi:predicted transcriptional regulator of viral defense system